MKQADGNLSRHSSAVHPVNLSNSFSQFWLLVSEAATAGGARWAADGCKAARTPQWAARSKSGALATAQSGPASLTVYAWHGQAPLAVQTSTRQRDVPDGAGWPPAQAAASGPAVTSLSLRGPAAPLFSLASSLRDHLAGLAAGAHLSPGLGLGHGLARLLSPPHALPPSPEPTPDLRLLPFASVTGGPSHPAPALSTLTPVAGTTSTGGPLGRPASGLPSPAAATAAAAKAEVGRATWTLLHTLAAQFPERPSRRQQRDARTLVDCLTRIYPCGDCATHFAELVRRDPPTVSSGPAFRRWLCRIHNRVNARLGKPAFNCDLVEARWAPLGCSAEEAEAGEPPRAGCELRGVGSAGQAGRRRG